FKHCPASPAFCLRLLLFQKRDPADRRSGSDWDSTRFSLKEPTMNSAIAIVDDGYSPPSWEQVRPVDKSLAPTYRTSEAASAHEPAVRAVVKGWPTLLGYENL